jgi:chromosome partitioning protein
MENIVISVAAPKGGVGKTTTAVNLAAGLALKKKKTLLIDVDSSGYCSSAFGYDERKIFGNVVDLYKRSKNVHEVIHKTELSYLEIIPFERIGYEEEVLFNKLTVDKNVLRMAIEKVKSDYDYIVLDCPPFLYGSTINSLIASDYLIIPVKSSKFSFEAVQKMMTFVEEIRKSENPNLKVDGLLLTMYESNTKVSFQIKKELYRLYPNQMFKTAIPKNTSVSESTFHNKPIMLFDKNAIASKAYVRFVDELIDMHETNNLMSISGFQNGDFLEDE